MSAQRAPDQTPGHGVAAEPTGPDALDAAPAEDEAALVPTSAAAADDDPTDDSGDVPALSVAGAARGLGVAAGTLRSWERRYGLAPSLHTKGGHRRYGPSDLARLQIMHRLVREGVPPAEAARVAIRTRIDPERAAQSAPHTALLQAGALEPLAGIGDGTTAGDRDGERGFVAGADDPHPGAPAGGSASPGGGRVLAMPRGTRTARGLARAAMALDSHACHRTVEASLAQGGTIPTWEELVRPVLAAIGEKWQQTGRGIEVEHSFSVVVAGALAAHAARLARPRNARPVLLASVPDELHDLPLVALQAALADAGIRSHVIGARTPEDALADAVQRLGPPVVFLWSQMGVVEPPALPAMRPAPVLVVGGPGWPHELPEDVIHVPELAAGVDAVRVAMGL